MSSSFHLCIECFSQLSFRSVYKISNSCRFCIHFWIKWELWKIFDGKMLGWNHFSGFTRCGIWVSSTSFQKSNIGWPQQPPKERVPDISKKLDFLLSISQKGTGFYHLCASDDLTLRISIFSMEWGCWGLWSCWGCRGHWGWKSSKTWKITTDPSRFLNSALFLCFEKKMGGFNHEI